MLVFGVHINNDEWPEDLSSAIVLVAAPNQDAATQAVEEYGEPLTRMHSVYDVEKISELQTTLLETTIITFFLI